MRRLSGEAGLFASFAAFGIVVGTIYWFLTYETAGTVLLLGFGLASAVASAVLSARTRGSEEVRHGTAARSEGDAAGEEEQIPAPAFAPFIVGLGAAVIALGLALGPLILPAGVVVIVSGARLWLAAVMRETDQSAVAERTTTAVSDPERAGRMGV